LFDYGVGYKVELFCGFVLFFDTPAFDKMHRVNFALATTIIIKKDGGREAPQIGSLDTLVAGQEHGIGKGPVSRQVIGRCAPATSVKMEWYAVEATAGIL
jgi:hypothetical protein